MDEKQQYVVVIVELATLSINVMASSSSEAISKISREYEEGDIILNCMPNTKNSVVFEVLEVETQDK